MIVALQPRDNSIVHQAEQLEEIQRTVEFFELSFPNLKQLPARPEGVANLIRIPANDRFHRNT
jgi:hypothetical protein